MNFVGEFIMFERKFFQLKNYNTLRMRSIAKSFFEIESESELHYLFINKSELLEDFKVLGEGSNLWLSNKEIPVVLKLNLKGIELDCDSKKIRAKVKAGESWSQFVEIITIKGASGVQFLVDIPGTVGAAPVQNIGAYGAEICEFIKSVKVFDTNTLCFRELSRADCLFSYRDSIFKRYNRLIITEVTFEFERLSEQVVENKEVSGLLGSGDKTPENLLLAVRELRSKKLPDYKLSPNAGSFFKNPIISKDLLEKLKKKLPELVYFEVREGFKVSAAYLIEKAGWKGKFIDDVGMSEMHALVFVNMSDNGNQAAVKYIQLLKNDILNKFNIKLDVEPINW